MVIFLAVMEMRILPIFLREIVMNNTNSFIKKQLNRNNPDSYRDNLNKKA
jgi:hypothetical protein